MWSWCFPSVFGIVAKFPWQKSDSILPYFRGGNLTVLPLRCVIAHKTLFSASFQCENMAMEMPQFYNENPVEFCVSCAMVHWQGFMLVYMACANMLVLGWAGAPQSIKHIDTCRIHRKTNVTWWHRSRRSNCSDYTHSVIWICTYSNCLKHILMSQGLEHSWPERVTHISTKVHHTKCMITHTHVGIYIYIHTYIHTYIHHAQCYHTEQGKQYRHCQHSMA